MEESFQTVVNKLPDSIQANVRFLDHYFSKSDMIEGYRQSVIENYYGDQDDRLYIFYPPFYKTALSDIHQRISYKMFDKVIRNGVICKYCHSNNTISKDKRQGGGDEYIPREIHCYKCGKTYRD